jgi:N-carbamoylputrescine amidase
VNPEAHEKADPIPGPATDRLAGLARDYDMMIAAGLAEKEGGRLYDSAVLIDDEGHLVLKHRKTNILTELMDPPYTPGKVEEIDAVETEFGRIGMLICADTFKEEPVEALAGRKPDLVIVPYGWAAPEGNWPGHGKSLEAWVVNTARRAACPVVGVDVVGTISHGPWKGFVYGGQSVVCDRDGTVLAVLGDRKEEVRTVEFVERD